MSERRTLSREYAVAAAHYAWALAELKRQRPTVFKGRLRTHIDSAGSTERIIQTCARPDIQTPLLEPREGHPLSTAGTMRFIPVRFIDSSRN